MFIGIEVRRSDLKRISIKCRCGNHFFIEIPIQLAQGHNVDDCAQCGALYHVQMDKDGKWNIERLSPEAVEKFHEEVARQEGRKFSQRSADTKVN